VELRQGYRLGGKWEPEKGKESIKTVDSGRAARGPECVRGTRA
jgi:hypothetical protein